MSYRDEYRITNMHDSVIWQGLANSFYDAWQEMFTACSYPRSEGSITQQIDLGMWIEKWQNNN